MRIAVVGLVAAVVGLASSRVSHAKPGAIVVPPFEAEIGAASAVGADDNTIGTATEFRIGFHWASLSWRPTPIDFGIGFVTTSRESFGGSIDRVATGPEDHSLSLKGAYVSGAYAIENHKHWRTWLGARLEMLSGSNQGERVTTTGVAVRLATELYSASAGGVADSHVAAFFAGAWALGVYVEGIHRGIPGDLAEVDAAAGLTMRIPFIAGVAD
ncbi:MAG TPA: hypothetical protein VMZ53_28340, partial [Kofleriaceae bacterium]|nr:hypothetical protein [Kofleriaceae bacterium]